MESSIPQTATIIRDERLEIPLAFGDVIDVYAYLLEQDWTKEEMDEFFASSPDSLVCDFVGFAPSGRLIYAARAPHNPFYSLGDFEKGVSVSVSLIGYDLAAD